MERGRQRKIDREIETRDWETGLEKERGRKERRVKG
jgi:hypothetical protein